MMLLVLISLTMVTEARMLRMASDCCSSVVMNVRDPGSEVHLLQGARLGFYSQIGFYGARPQYRLGSETSEIHCYFKVSVSDRTAATT